MDNTISLKKALEKRRRLLRQAEEVWNRLAEELLALVPDALDGFMDEMSWCKPKHESVTWLLPSFLEGIHDQTKRGWCERLKFHDSRLNEDGFASFEELKSAFQLLVTNWSKVVKINIVDERDGPGVIYVEFRSNEIPPEEIEDTTTHPPAP